MSPRPSEDVRTQLKEEVAAAMKKRANQAAEAERLKEAAEAEFWRSIDGLRQRYHGAQTDIAEATKYTRDHILKQVKRYASDAEGGGTQ